MINMSQNREQAQELDFLRFFYFRASDGMGPASDDVYEYIKDEYMSNGGIVPPKYASQEDDNG